MSLKGKISQVMGAVVDVVFEEGNLPEIYNALFVAWHGAFLQRFLMIFLQTVRREFHMNFRTDF